MDGDVYGYVIDIHMNNDMTLEKWMYYGGDCDVWLKQGHGLSTNHNEIVWLSFLLIFLFRKGDKRNTLSKLIYTSKDLS